MPYIGQSPTQTAFVTDTFSGNGSTTAFTMSVAPANTASALVAVSGVLQDPSTYSVSGTTLTFSAAPPTGTGNISVRFLGIPASGVTTTAYRTQTEFTATAGQTTFTPASYTVGFIDVYRNGVLLGSADFTATNGTTVVLAIGANAGDLIETVSFFVSSVLNAIPATPGAVSSNYIQNSPVLTGTTTIPTATVTTLNAPSGVLATQNGMTGIAKAWVNFQGGNGNTAGTINASFNVSSITVNGTGDYTVNFTTAMPNAYYVTSGLVKEGTSGGAGDMYLTMYESSTNPATTSVRVNARYGTSSVFNVTDVYVMVVGS
jgi:hypothetical protein